MITAPVPFLVARQPIWDRDHKVVGFEILFRRHSADTRAIFEDGSAASAQVMVEGVIVDGLASLTGGLPAWINVTKELLAPGVSSVLHPSRSFVLEVLEDIPFDYEVLRACREARRDGFRLALDDVTTPDRIREAQGTAEIAKIDMQAADGHAFRAIASLARAKGLKVLAEKVETDVDLALAVFEGSTSSSGMR